MKKIILLFVIPGSFSFAQDIPVNQVPAIVINAFQQKYSKAQDVEWEKKGEIFEVEFETGIPSKDHTMWIDKGGKVIMHSQDMVKTNLPAVVKKSIKNQFPGYVIDDVVKTDRKGVITYKMELKKRPEERKVTFSADGKIIENVLD